MSVDDKEKVVASNRERGENGMHARVIFPPNVTDENNWEESKPEKASSFLWLGQPVASWAHSRCSDVKLNKDEEDSDSDILCLFHADRGGCC